MALHSFQTTAAPFLLMAPFALSNGLLAALALTAAPPLVAASDRELAGNLMGCSSCSACRAARCCPSGSSRRRRLKIAFC